MGQNLSLDTLLNRAFDQDTNQLKVDTEITVSGGSFTMDTSSLAKESTLAARASESTLSGLSNINLGIRDDSRRLTTAYDATSGGFKFREVTPDNLNNANVTIISGGTLIIASNANRYEVLIYNNSSNKIFVGSSGTILQPVPTDKGINFKTKAAIYGVPETGNTADVRYSEESY